MISIYVTPEQYALLVKPVTGKEETWGGFQRLIVRLQAGLEAEGDGYRLSMTVADAETCVTYCNERYGSGGFQSRIRPLEGALRSALNAVPKNLSLF